MMVGRSVRFDIDKAPCTPGEAVLEIKNLSVKDSVGTMKVKDLSLTVRRGEIMGVAGVDGNGQSELLYALSGLSPVAGGEIILSGRVINKDTIMERIEEGMGHIPEDRRKHGLVAGLTVAENLALKDFNSDKYSGPFGMLNFRAMEENAEKLISEFDIRTAQGNRFQGNKPFPGCPLNRTAHERSGCGCHRVHKKAHRRGEGQGQGNSACFLRA